MKCQVLFSRKNKKNITSLSSAEFAHSMVSVNNKSGPSCSKLTMSLVNDSLKF